LLAATTVRAKHIFNHLAAIARWLYDPNLTDKSGT